MNFERLSPTREGRFCVTLFLDANLKGEVRMLDFALVRTGEGQPVSCRRCPDGPINEAYDAVTISRSLDTVLSHAGQAGAPDILFAGGEPLALDEFATLVATARTTGARRIAALTCGAPLADEGDTSLLVREGLRHAHIGLLGPAADSNDDLLGTSGFDAAMAGMRAFRAAGADQGVRVALYGRVPVCAHNMELLPETVSRLAREGATAVALVVRQGVDMRRVRPWLVAAFETGLTCGVWVWIEGADPALLGPAAMASRAPMRIVEVGA